MAATTDLLTLAEARAALNIDAGDTTYDTDLARVISAASEVLKEWIGQVVVNGTVTETFDGGRPYIDLPSTPVFSVTSVTEYVGTTGTALTLEALGGASTSTNYRLRRSRPHEARLSRRSGGGDSLFAWGSPAVAVVYTPGRVADTASVSPLIKEGAARVLVALWDARGAGANAGTPNGDGRFYGGALARMAKVREEIEAMMSNELRDPWVA